MAELERRIAATPAPPPFVSALRRSDVAVIAELKRRSPSKGELDPTLDASARTRAYAQGGAAALSILTEPNEFGGSLDDLATARASVHVPLLRKDFIVDEVQLMEARAFGASAALLIVRALPPARLRDLANSAFDLGLGLLIEVRTEGELERALEIKAAAVGVNNRNLETLQIDDAVSERLLQRIPADRVAVYESGIRDVTGVHRASSLGADAVLVGSSLSVQGSAVEAVRALAGVPKVGRG